MKQAGFEGWNLRSIEPFVNQMVSVPDVLVAGEAEEMIDDATATCGDVDLVGCHPNMVATGEEMSQATRFLVVTLRDFFGEVPVTC